MTSRYDGLITQITLPKGLDYDTLLSKTRFTFFNMANLTFVKCHTYHTLVDLTHKYAMLLHLTASYYILQRVVHIHILFGN